MLGVGVVDVADHALDARTLDLFRHAKPGASVEGGQRGGSSARGPVVLGLMVDVKRDNVRPAPLHFEGPETVPLADVERPHAVHTVWQSVALHMRAQVEPPVGHYPGTISIVWYQL